MAKVFTPEENQKVLIEKDKELDLLKDDKSKFIYTGTGKHRILVDNDCEFDRCFKVKAKRGYVEVTVYYRNAGKTRFISFGRFILGIKNQNIRVDHSNKNPLDNRESNLRICDQSQNLGNRKMFSKINMYKGYHKKGSYITVASQKYGVITSYKINTQDEEYAAIVYDCVAVVNHGEFAETNFNIKNYTLNNIKEVLDPINHLKKTRIKCTVKTDRFNTTKSIEDLITNKGKAYEYSYDIEVVPLSHLLEIFKDYEFINKPKK